MDNPTYHQEYYQKNKEQYKKRYQENIETLRVKNRKYKASLAPKRKATAFINRFNNYPDEVKELIIPELQKLLQ
jgi:hypothetical protein